MLQNQCRAFCQCEFCKYPTDKEKRDDCCIHICSLHATDNGPSKDELYARYLQMTNQKRALAASKKNAHLFVPDELLASSRAKRDAKHREIASQLVPVRRRDRLQELLLLEHASRIREAKKLRAERRAHGLPADSDEEAESNEGNEEQYEECACIPTGQPPLRSESTPSSKCSAEHDLHSTLDAIGNIVNDSSYNARPADPLNRTQIFQLRKLVHERAKKDRKQVEECPNQPHLCPHCFAVNVQGKHLCPQMSGSVAFRTTGKVINPNNRVKFGVTEQEALSNGQYDDSVTRSGMGKTGRLEEFNPHPYGTGVIFPPLKSANDQDSKMKPRHDFFSGAPVGKPGKELFNNNICNCQPAQNDLQYPGSTYNVYDDRDGSYGHACDCCYSQENICDHCREGAAQHATEGEPIIRSGAAESVPQSGNELLKKIKSTSALWRTTNMEREADLERFLDFQKKCLKAASKDVYGAGIRVS